MFLSPYFYHKGWSGHFLLESTFIENSLLPFCNISWINNFFIQWQGSIDAKGYGTIKQYIPIKKKHYFVIV